MNYIQIKIEDWNIMKNLVHENYFHKRINGLNLEGEWEFGFSEKKIKDKRYSQKLFMKNKFIRFEPKF